MLQSPVLQPVTGRHQAVPGTTGTTDSSLGQPQQQCTPARAAPLRAHLPSVLQQFKARDNPPHQPNSTYPQPNTSGFSHPVPPATKPLWSTPFASEVALEPAGPDISAPGRTSGVAAAASPMPGMQQAVRGLGIVRRSSSAGEAMHLLTLHRPAHTTRTAGTTARTDADVPLVHPCTCLHA